MTRRLSLLAVLAVLASYTADALASDKSNVVVYAAPAAPTKPAARALFKVRPSPARVPVFAGGVAPTKRTAPVASKRARDGSSERLAVIAGPVSPTKPIAAFSAAAPASIEPGDITVCLDSCDCHGDG